MKMPAFCKTVCALLLALSIASSAFAAPWKFGIMADTQWLDSPDGKNPNSVAVGVINQLNQAFIGHGVRFVVAAGDLTDNGSNLALDTRATFAQALYNSGIGFYPLRGNHESSSTAAIEFKRIFPQTRTGVNNQTPSDARVTTTYYGPPPANTNTTFTVGSNFSSPSADFAGLTYSFDYENARFVLLDQFAPISGASHNNLDSSDVTWVNDLLSGRPAETHAFVFGHKHLISETLVDTLFGADPGDPATLSLQNDFISHLYNNGVRYYIGGHDHMHNRALVTSPDGNWNVQDIIATSDGVYLNSPANPSNDYTYNDLGGAGPVAGNSYPREMEISQDLLAIGYYVATVDGPKVTMDYYAASACDGCIQTYKFSKRETFGYSLNGKEFLVAQEGSYTSVQDSYNGTTARILAGTNTSAAAASDGRPMTKTVDTGWTPRTTATASDLLTLWGMTDINAASTDTFVLALTYNPAGVTDAQIQSGTFGLKVQDGGGNWIDAVDQNDGGSKQFVVGAWSAGAHYALGTYGVDPAANTVWAVINYNSTFAVGPPGSMIDPPVTTASASGYTFGAWTSSSTVAVTLSASAGYGIAAGYPKYCVDSTDSCTPSTSYGAPLNVTCASGTVCIQYVRYYSVDNAGNIETVKSSVVMQDLKSPVTTPSPAGGTYSSSQSVSLTCSDSSASGCAYTYYCSGSGCTPTNQYTGVISISSSADLRFSSTDAAGNTETVKTAAYVIDATAPTTTASASGHTFNTWSGSGTVTVSLSASDGSGSGVKAGYPKYCEDNSNICTPNITYSTAFNVTCASGSVCLSYVRYQSLDTAGNLETIKSSLVKQDLQAPTTTPSVNGGLYTATQHVALGCSDGAGSGCSSIYYCQGSGCTPSTLYSGSITIAASTTLRYSSTDAAGNSEAVSGQTYTIDNTPPSLTLSALADGSSTNDATMDLSGITSDADGIQSVVVNSHSVTPTTSDNITYAFNYTVTLVTGPNVITTVVTDKAGNATTDTRAIILDQSAPGLTITSPSDNSVTNSPTVAVTGTTNEPATVLISVNSGQGVTVTTNGTTFSHTVTLSTNAINTIDVSATDLAGNTATVRRTVTNDQAGPTLAVTVPNQDMGTQQTNITISGTVSDLTNVTISASCPTASVGAVSTPTATTWSVNVANLQPGVNSVTIKATDQAGNSTTVIRSISNTATPITLNAVTSPTNVNSQTISGTRAQNATVTVACPTATVGTVTYPSATAWQTVLTQMSPGNNAITAIATDLLGNVSSPVSAAIVLDTTAPVTTASPVGGQYNAAQTITLTADKPGAIYFTTDGTTPTAGSTVYSAPLVVTTSTVLQYFAKDLAGNNEAVRTQTYTIDTIAPAVSIGAPSASLTRSGVINYQVTFTGADTITLASDKVTLNSTGTGAGTLSVSGTGVSTRTVSISSITGNGRLGISIGAGAASDLAGNMAPGVGPSATFVVDNTLPSLTLSTLADGSTTNNATLNLSGTAGDINGIQSLVVNDQTVALNTTDNINYTFSYPTTLITGQNVITTVATDKAGNTTSDTRTIILDQSAPGLTITSPADNSFTNTASLTVVGTVDSTATVMISLEGGPPITAVEGGTSFSQPISLATGLNTITIVATDLAGNTTTAKRTVTYDGSNPLLAIMSPSQDLSMNQASLTLSGTVGDNTNVALLANCPTATAGVITNPSAGTWQVTITNMTQGVNVITVTATDQAGNSTAVSRNIIYDLTPPTITVDPITTPTGTTNQTIRGTREQNATVAVDSLTATVGSVTYPSATTWQAYLTLMNEGNNTITITATDSAGNTGSPLNIAIEYDPYLEISGDMNGDGVVDINDALGALRIAVGLYTPNAEERTHSDVAPLVIGVPHPDGKIDINDVVAILRRSAGLLSW